MSAVKVWQKVKVEWSKLEKSGQNVSVQTVNKRDHGSIG